MRQHKPVFVGAMQAGRYRIGYWLLALCLVGTQLIGLVHSIVHSGALQSHVIENSIAAQKAFAVDHSCTLFDALALGSCAGTTDVCLPAGEKPAFFLPLHNTTPVVANAPTPFRSRAPPSLLS